MQRSIASEPICSLSVPLLMKFGFNRGDELGNFSPVLEAMGATFSTE
jgi:hypothetical protein